MTRGSLRTKSEVLMSLPIAGKNEVERMLAEATEHASTQNALAWELRLALTVAHVRASQGKKNEARETLERVYFRFTEGFDTNDLKAAAQAIRSM